MACRCHLRPCDTGEASTASSPHVALAGVERVRGGGTKPLLLLVQSVETTPLARAQSTRHKDKRFRLLTEKKKKTKRVKAANSHC